MNVASQKALGTAIGIYEWTNDLLKQFGIVAGGLAASLADWVFGAVTMTIMLSNYGGFNNSYTKWVVGGIFSLALWGVQIILWQVILSGRVFQLFKDRSPKVYVYILVALVILAMKFGDDLSDIAGFFWLIKDNPMQFEFSKTLYDTVLYTVFFLIWVVCGFAEVFVALSINLMKGGQKQEGKPPDNRGGGNNHKHQQFQPQYRPQERRDGGGGQSREQRLEELRKKYPVTNQTLR